jgi:hypothetical protein
MSYWSGLFHSSEEGSFRWQRSIDTCVLSRCLVLTHTNGREPPVRCVAVSPICGGSLRIASRCLVLTRLHGRETRPHCIAAWYNTCGGSLRVVASAFYVGKPLEGTSKNDERAANLPLQIIKLEHEIALQVIHNS